MNTFKDKLISVISSIAMIGIYGGSIIIPLLGIYHVNQKHHDELLISIITPWSFYRGFEYFWHSKDEITTQNANNNDSQLSQKEDKWILYTPENNAFSVKLPSMPMVEQTSLGGAKTTTYTTFNEKAQAFYKIEYTTIPTSIKMPLKNYIENWKKTIKINIDQEKLNDSSYTLEGTVQSEHLPKELNDTFSWIKDAKAKMIVIKINDVLVINTAIFDKHISADEVNLFFDSFQIKP